MAELRPFLALLMLLTAPAVLASAPHTAPGDVPSVSRPGPLVHPSTPDTVYKLTASDSAPFRLFGRTLASSGDAVLVGVGGGGGAPGGGYVFRWNGTGWVEEAKLIPSGNFVQGEVIALRGDVALIGDENDDDLGSNAGAVYVFRFDGTMWVEETKLTAGNGAAGHRFGTDVAVDDDVVLVRALNNNTVYVFRFNGAAWVEEAQLPASNSTVAGLAVDDDVILLGNRTQNEARVYRFDGVNWTQEAVLTASDGDFDLFGAHVALSGDVALVGADEHGVSHGAAYVYRFNGSSWVEETELLSSNRESFEDFGSDVALEGDLAVVSTEPFAYPISTYVYRFDGQDWQEVYHPVSFMDFDEFGQAVATSNGHVFVGAPRDDEQGSDAGAVYAYAIPFETLPALALSDRRLFETPVRGTLLSDTLTIRNGGTDLLEWSLSSSETWLSTDVALGLLAPGDSTSVRLDLDATGLAVRAYNAALTLTTNDPDDAMVTVPVYVQVHADTLVEAKLIGHDTAPGDEFGGAVAVSGDRAVVGAVDHNGGAAYVFRWNGSSWVEEAELTPSEPAAFFSGRVAIAGDVIVVSTGERVVSTLASHKVYVFRWDGQVWVEEAVLTSPNALTQGDRFGGGIAVQDDVILVGAPSTDPSEQGLVYVFRYNGQAWEIETTLEASDGGSFHRFGSWIALHESLAAIKGDHAAYVFRRDSTTWVEEAKLTASDGGSLETMALGEEVVMAGWPWDETFAFNGGGVYVFEHEDSAWVEKAKLFPSDGFRNDEFGRSVALDGTKALIGAAFHPRWEGPGAAYVFERVGGTWIQRAKLVPSDGHHEVHNWNDEIDEFGDSVALADSLALVVAPFADAFGLNAGAVYGYELGTAPAQQQRYYYLTDHLGSVRATVNEAGAVVHYDDYYPFGMPMPGRNYVAGEEGDPAGKPRFTGHEQEVDIDPEYKAVYYAGARYYDGLIGRWDTVDPLNEFYSPYSYVGNNPVAFVDPTGLSSEAVQAAWDDCQSRSQDTCSYDGSGNYTGGGDEPYSGGIQLFEVAAHKGQVPYGLSDPSGRFQVGDYTLLPNYITNDNGEAVLSHYTASVGRRVDWILGVTDLADFMTNAALLAGAAGLMYGGSDRLAEWQIKFLAGEGGWLSGYLKEQWTNPYNLIAAAHIGMAAWPQATGRVFWSGGENAMQEATQFAKNNGMMTLGMTRAGRNLSALTKGMPAEQRLAMWNKLSAAYANGAKGNVHVFHSARGVATNSTWATSEYSILQANGVRIIYHIVK